jgi:Bacterial pre-peptidase C-terminal domain
MLNQSSGQFTTRAADDRPNGARNIGTLNGARKFRDSVGVNDKFDYYSFSVSGRSSFNLKLDKLKNNVDVALIQNGQTVARSTRGGKKPEAIAATLEAGTYFVKVSQRSGNSRYRLSLNVNPISLPPLPPPQGLEGANVNFGVYLPTPTTPISTSLNAVVNSAVEFPEIGNTSLPGRFFTINADVDVNARQIIIDYSQFARASSADFNGYVFNFAGNNIPTITGAFLGAGSTFSSTQVGLSFDNDSVFVNVANLSIAPDSQIVIDLQV